jgi:hypothetical protein
MFRILKTRLLKINDMKKIILLSFLAAIALVSCEKFGEKNITKSVVVLLSPTQNQSDSILTKLFWWEEVEGADSYHLQVVSTTFENISSLAVDTLLSGVKFQLTMVPGDFQWRVRAENGAYETPWTTYNLTITNTSSLAGQTITTATPVDGYVTKDTAIAFNWSALSKATSYHFIIQNSLNNDVLNTTVSTNTKAFPFTTEGKYSWSVQGLNNTSASNTTKQYITIDKTKPNTPVLTYPKAVTDTIYSLPATFTWDIGNDTGSEVTHSIDIGTDSTFNTNILHSAEVIDLKTYSLTTLNNTGELFWRVRSVDAAGNTSSYSVAKPFIKKN